MIKKRIRDRELIAHINHNVNNRLAIIMGVLELIDKSDIQVSEVEKIDIALFRIDELCRWIRTLTANIYDNKIDL